MKTNLALYILIYLIDQHSVNGNIDPVPLSDFKIATGVPNATFHKHVRSLIKCGLIERVKRDQYRIGEHKAWALKRALRKDMQIPMYLGDR